MPEVRAVLDETAVPAVGREADARGRPDYPVLGASVAAEVRAGGSGASLRLLHDLDCGAPAEVHERRQGRATFPNHA